MIKLQNSKFFKAFCLFMAFAIFNLSCTDAGLQNSHRDCLSLEYSISDFENVEFYYENAMQLAHTLNHENKYASHEAFLQDISEKSSESEGIITSYADEYRSYGVLGFEPYLSDVESRGFISTNFKEALVGLTSNISSYIRQNHPSLENLKAHITNQSSDLSALNLCEEDEQSVILMLDMFKGYANYMYKHAPENYLSGEYIETRDCNWLESVLCGLIAIPIGLTITVVAGVLLHIAVIKPNDGTTFEKLRDGLLVSYIVALSVAIGWEVGTSIYEWCCGIEEQVCEPPTGFYIQPQDCDLFKYGVYGPSFYSTTSWGNSNTEPSQAISPVSSIDLRIPSPGNISVIGASILCISDETDAVLFPHTNSIIFDYDESAALPTPQWGYAPPSNASINMTYEISVTLGSDNTTGLTWSVSPFGGSVTSTGDYSGNLNFFTIGTKTVTATFTDLCNGESVSISKEVNVN